MEKQRNMWTILITTDHILDQQVKTPLGYNLDVLTRTGASYSLHDPMLKRQSISRDSPALKITSTDQAWLGWGFKEVPWGGQVFGLLLLRWLKTWVHISPKHNFLTQSSRSVHRPSPRDTGSTKVGESLPVWRMTYSYEYIVHTVTIVK